MTTAIDITEALARNQAAWRASSTLLYQRRIDEFVQTWCEDGVYEAALPVPGFDAVVAGREALHAVFSGLVAAVTELGVEDVVLHQTDDPDVIVVEETMVGRLADGYEYRNRMVLRVRFRGDRIAHMLEYYGQLAHADLLRHLGFIE